MHRERSGGRAYPKTAKLGTGDLGYLGQCRVMLAKDLACAFKQVFTGLGQDHSTWCSSEQLKADLILDLPDLHRDRSLSHVHATSSRRKRLCLSNRQKRFKLSYFHIGDVKL